jgi:ribonuclease HII
MATGVAILNCRSRRTNAEGIATLRWVGIDEAGYGPNLGPLVMTAVVAESTSTQADAAVDVRTLDFWAGLAETVDRAGGHPDRLWVDDSKAIYQGGTGRDRLETACMAVVQATGRALPGCLRTLIEVLGAGTLADVELTRWIEADEDHLAWPFCMPREALDALLRRTPLHAGNRVWRITAVACVVIGPARFNRGLAVHDSKAAVHFSAFDVLLQQIWDRAADGRRTFVCCDKHGGRHYYLPPLSQAFPEAWIDRGPEGPDLSRYTIRDGDRRLELSLAPRADQTDGLVALASIVSKTVRELWMDVFNAYWRRRIPDLRPTAGYPNDALRFRREIEARAQAEGNEPAHWWRLK